MEKIKILHAADIHFDTPFKDVGESQSKINKEELKEVFRKVINITKEEKVDILLLAGDIFDNFTLSKETLYFIERTLKLINDIPVFISPGNHDPYGNNSFYKLVNWPENVHIFKGSLERVYLSDLNVNVWGAGFKEKYVNESMIKDFKVEDDKINIMVLHGEISNSKDGNEYNPITLNEIENSNMDYIALGHRHSFSGIEKQGSTYYAYSGCPQGRGFDECGDKGVICGYITKGAVDLQFIRTSKRNYEEIHIDISNCFTYEEIKNAIKSNIDAEYRRNNLYKLVLVGSIEEGFNIDKNILEHMLNEEFYYCKVIDKTTVKLNMDELTKGYSVKSIFASKLKKSFDEAESEEEKEIIMMALKIGISSLIEGEVKVDDY